MYEDKGTVHDMAAWVHDVARSAGFVRDASLPHVVDTWQSRTAMLHRFTWESNSSPNVVAKVHGKPHEAEVQFHSMCRMADVLNDVPMSEFAVFRPLGYSAQFGAVAMPYVAGSRLSELLTCERWTSGTVRDRMLRHVYSCGLLLAKYHSKSVGGTAEMRKAARTDLEARIGKVSGKDFDVGSMELSSGLVVQSYGDFHPGHVMITRENRIALLDPPTESRYRYAHRDIAVFIYGLFMNLVHPRRLWSVPVRWRYFAMVRSIFLNGYMNGIDQPFTNDDRLVIDGCEAFLLKRMLRETVRQRSFARAAYYFTPVEARSIALRHALLGHVRRRRRG